MKLKISKQELAALIGKAQNIVEKRTTMPILVNVLLDAQNERLKIFATDLEISLTDEAPVEISEPGRVAVNAKNLFEIVRELPDGTIIFEKRENNWLRISQNKAVFNIVGVSPEEYPVFPSFSTTDFVTMETAILREMIEKTIYSVATDETRFHLNGVFLEKTISKDGTVYRMVATDGHRLSLIDRKAEGDRGSSSTTPSPGVIIPRKGLHDIRKLLETAGTTVAMAIEGSQMIIKANAAVLMVRLLEGKYPNYQQLIPQNLRENLLVRRDLLLNSLKRVSLLANAKSRGVTLILSKGKMEISSNNPELGDAREEIDVDYSGKDLRIGFNARYILEILASMNEEMVRIELSDQLSPGLMRPKDDKSYTCVVMPMRI
jgi:DNA polymerase III subunit beta